MCGNDYSHPNMNQTPPPPVQNQKPADAPAAAPPTTPPAKRRPWLFYGCGALLLLVLLIVVTVAITIWYIQRPIKPVELTQKEKAVVEQKLERLTNPAEDRARTTVLQEPIDLPEPDRHYEPGSKVLRLTERELNGLLNMNTELGNTVRLELGRDAINAYIAAPIPEDVPVMGGKIFRARGRFRVSVSDAEAPYIILEDVTVFGLSLPKAWLGGLKGENLLADAVGRQDGEPVLKGVKSFRIEPGALVLEVED